MTANRAAPSRRDLVEFPLAWRIIRNFWRGRLVNPTRWLRATGFPTSLPNLTLATEAYLGEKTPYVNLSHRVMFDELKHGEAAFIDSDSDVLRTFVILALARFGSGLEAAPRIDLGDTLYWRRERLRAVVDEIRTRIGELAEVFNIPGDASRALDLLAGAIEEGTARYEARAAEAIRDSALSEPRVEAFLASVRARWKSEEPRRLLAEVGSLSIEKGRPRRSRILRVDQLIPKEFFVDREAVESDTSLLAEELTDAMLRGEQQAIVRELRKLRPTMSTGSLRHRVKGTLTAMARVGREATHVFAPMKWELDVALRELGIDPWLDHEASRTETPTIVKWVEADPEGLYFVHLPAGLRLTELDRDGLGLRVTVQDLGEDEAHDMLRRDAVRFDTPPGDPVAYLRERVRIVLTVGVSVSLSRRDVRRVLLPPELVATPRRRRTG